MARHYVIIKQQTKWSKHGGQVTEITLVGLDDRKLYTTWIDAMNMNAKYWSHITRSPLDGRNKPPSFDDFFRGPDA